MSNTHSITKSARGQSGIFAGAVRHRRRFPFVHEFRYPLMMVLLDLDELDQVFRGRWCWSTSRWAIARFSRADHFGPADQPLQETIRALVTERTGLVTTGPIRLLTQLRYFGYVMNPISLYFCYDSLGQQVQAVVAEVHNTPWQECHCYVLPANEDARKGRLRATQPKTFHVSPFMPMNMDYRWWLKLPSNRFTVHLENWQEGELRFDATLTMTRHEISTTNLAWALVRYPLMTVQIIVQIYWQAFRLWQKGARYYPHPATTPQ